MLMFQMIYIVFGHVNGIVKKKEKKKNRKHHIHQELKDGNL